MKEVHLVKFPIGMVTEDCFSVVEVPIPDVKPGDFLVKNILCSTDPYMRSRIGPRSPTGVALIGQPMFGDAIGQVVESKNSKYPEGTYLYHSKGWREYALFEDDEFVVDTFEPFGNIFEYCLKYFSFYGLVGKTAYYALNQIIKPSITDTVAVSGASGGVGYMFTQFASSMGIKVYGITSNDSKTDFIESMGGSPVHIPRNSDFSVIRTKLSKTLEDQVSGYMENVGHDYMGAMMQVMKYQSTACFCGALKHYNTLMPGPGPNLFPIIYKDITIKSVNLRELETKNFKTFVDVHFDNLKESSHVYDGIEKMPTQFIDHFTNEDIVGKSLCRIL